MSAVTPGSSVARMFTAENCSQVMSSMIATGVFRGAFPRSFRMRWRRGSSIGT